MATTAPGSPNVAVPLQRLGNFAAAERSTAAPSNGVRPDNPSYAARLNNLAGLLQATNRLAEAEPLFRRALAIGERSYGPDHPNVAMRLNNLAELLQATNRLAEAEPLYRRALAIDERRRPRPPRRRQRPQQPGGSCSGPRTAWRRPSRSIRRALAIDEAVYGPDHPDVATDLNNLAQLLQATNRLAEAEPLYPPGAGDRRAELSAPTTPTSPQPQQPGGVAPGHEPPGGGRAAVSAGAGDRRAVATARTIPNVATDLNNLAALLAGHATGWRRPSRCIAGRWRSTRQSYGPDHPNVATALNNLAVLLQATNRLAEAEPLLPPGAGDRRGIATARTTPTSPRPSTTWRSCSGPPTAWPRPSRCTAGGDDRREVAAAASHPNVASDLNNLAHCSRPPTAWPRPSHCTGGRWRSTRHRTAPTTPPSPPRLNNLAAAAAATNRLADAEPLYRRALVIHEASYGPDHPTVATDLNNLAELLRASNRLGEAEPARVFRRAVEIFCSSSPTQPATSIPTYKPSSTTTSGCSRRWAGASAEIKARLEEMARRFGFSLKSGA